LEANKPQYNRLPLEFAEALRGTIAVAEAAEAEARHAAFEAARPILEAEAAELAAKKEAEKEAKKAEVAEYRGYYALLPKMVRERHSAEFASKEEIVDLIGKMILAEAGLTEAGHAFERCAGTETLDVLTDEQFSALLAAKQRAPTGSEVVPVTAFDRDSYYRPSDASDEDIDSDGEVKVPREGECFRILVTWSRGGIEVDALVAPGDSWLA
jgi:uncharacterized membrane protein YqiK